MNKLCKYCVHEKPSFENNWVCGTCGPSHELFKPKCCDNCSFFKDKKVCTLNIKAYSVPNGWSERTEIERKNVTPSDFCSWGWEPKEY